MGLVLDLLVVVIISIFAFISAKWGFVRTLIEIVGFVLVVLLANSLSTPLADITYDKTIEPAIIKSIDGMKVEDVETIDLNDKEFPPLIKRVLGDKNVIANFEKEITSDINNGIDTAVRNSSQNVIKPVITSILSVIYVLLISIILMFVVNILAKVINKLFSFSIVGKLNSTLGASLGVIKGIFIAFVVCTLISLIVSFTQNGFLIFTKDTIESSYIFKLLCLKF